MHLEPTETHPVILDTRQEQLWASGLRPCFLSPYADGEATNRPLLLRQLSDATACTRDPRRITEGTRQADESAVS